MNRRGFLGRILGAVGAGVAGMAAIVQRGKYLSSSEFTVSCDGNSVSGLIIRDPMPPESRFSPVVLPGDTVIIYGEELIDRVEYLGKQGGEHVYVLTETMLEPDWPLDAEERWNMGKHHGLWRKRDV